MRKSTLALLAFLFFGTNLKGVEKNYLDYHRNMNVIIQELISDNYPEAILKLDKILVEYDFVFTKDCFIGFQFAVKNKDEARIKLYFRKARENGLRLWQILKIHWLKTYFSEHPSLKRELEKIDTSFQSSIDFPQKKFFADMYATDEHYKLEYKNNTSLYLDIVRKLSHRIIDTFRVYKSPMGEKSLGVNDTAFYVKYRPALEEVGAYSPGFCYSNPLVVLFHDACNFPKIRKLMFEAIKTGECHPGTYALFYERYYQDRKLYNCDASDERKEYYNVYRKTGADIDSINFYRAKIGLTSLQNEKAIVDFEWSSRMKLRTGILLSMF